MSSYPYRTPTSWIAADTRLRHKTSRNPVQSRKIANNTWLQRRDNGDIAVKLHDTDVVIFHHPNGPDSGRLSIFTGGWNTITTRDRINQALPGELSVFTHRRVAYIALSRDERWNPRTCATLSEGFSVREDGTEPRHGDRLTVDAPPRSQRDRGGWASRDYLIFDETHTWTPEQTDHVARTVSPRGLTPAAEAHWQAQRPNPSETLAWYRQSFRDALDVTETSHDDLDTSGNGDHLTYNSCPNDLHCYGCATCAPKVDEPTWTWAVFGRAGC